MLKMIVKVLRNPFSAFVAMGLGVLLGIYYKPIATKLEGIGEIYRLLLQMTVIPILLCAITSSIGRFIGNRAIHYLLPRLVTCYILFSILYAVVGILSGLIFKPGNIPEAGRAIISEQVSIQSNVLEMNLQEESTQEAPDSFILKLTRVIPSNIFLALTSNNIMSILLFAILFGLAAGTGVSKSGLKHHKSLLILELFEHLYNTFTVIISYVLSLLPIALVFIIAGEIAKSGFSIFVASAKMIILFYGTGLALIIINSIFLSISTKKSLISTFRNSLYFSLVAFTTRNSFASMPITMTTLKNKFGIAEHLIKLVFPIFIVLGRFGNILYFAIVATFASQLYFISLGTGAIIYLALGIIVSGMATAGASGFATLGMLAIVLEPLGIPFETTLVILLSIDPIIDPLRSLLIVHANAALTAYSLKNVVTKNSYAQTASHTVDRNLEVYDEIILDSGRKNIHEIPAT